MTSIVTSAKDLLVSAGIGIAAATSGWGIFAGIAPNKPNTVIALKFTGGQSPNPKWLLDFPTMQIRVRGEPRDYANTLIKAQEVKDALLGINSQIVNGDTWVSVTMNSDIAEIAIDEEKRHNFVLNFSLIVEPATGTNRVSL